MRKILVILLFPILCNAQLLPQQGPLLYTANQDASIPAIVDQVNVAPGTVSSHVVTPNTTPVAGNLLIYVMGGSQTRTVSGPSGWVQNMTATSGGGTLEVWIKTATGSEPSSYTFTIGGGTLTGGFSYFELSGVNTQTQNIFTPDNGIAGTSKAYSSYNITPHEFTIIALAGKTNLGSGSADNSFTTVNNLGQRFKCAYRIYSAPATGEITTWTWTTSDQSLMGIIGHK